MKCAYCQKEFTPSKKDPRIKFCSEKCRIANRDKTNYMKQYYEKHKDKWEKRRKTPEYKKDKNTKRRKNITRMQNIEKSLKQKHDNITNDTQRKNSFNIYQNSD